MSPFREDRVSFGSGRAPSSMGAASAQKKLSEKFSLTPREAEVFGLLVNTEDGLQTIADNMYISRRTLERYVSAIYGKTGTKSRIGLVSLYNNI
jgi:DNA-binding CsgD family transcriptional regulator